MAAKPKAKPKRAPSRRVTLSLTPKQFEAIRNALSEWSQIEDQTVSGGRIAGFLRRTRRAIEAQAADAQAARRGTK